MDIRPGIIAEIEKAIYDWTSETEGIVVKSDRDRFVYLFEQKYLEKIKAINPLEMSPMDALNFLYRLKEEMKKEECENQ